MSACPLCGDVYAPPLLAKSSELRPSIVRLIAQVQPTWQSAAGLCPACALLYAERFAAQRSATSLHSITEPPTTFPYYHPAEETVLSQPLRLPDYQTFNGRGVTMAFLDSGYYPHPDLTLAPRWPGVQPAWATLAAEQWQPLLQQAKLRLTQYVDLTDDQERVGLDQPSLWDGAGDSWHGQMTTVLAAGNGLLSEGRFRGYAARANILAIKIGRGGGRIPEADILRGFQWLLRDRNWQRYNVRVVNVSVGGDFPESWRQNAVCLAAEQLSAQGVLIAAAAGNRGRAELLAPAQAPSVLTVGGFDDANRLWQPTAPVERDRLTLYPHNYSIVTGVYKPELLALARWLPSPILPASPVLGETIALGKLHQSLHTYGEQHNAARQAGLLTEQSLPGWWQETWHAVRKGMNAHKWIHPFYQHVDGTSVAVAQVSAVAAQMFEANPNLTAAEVRALLLATALPLPHQPAALTGQGILQPTQAVAAALRTANGILTDLPRSATIMKDDELQKWQGQGKVIARDFTLASNQAASRAVYFGYYAPQAVGVSLLGSFNHWQPEQLFLQRLPNGWWHTVVALLPGQHLYRFWVNTGRYTEPEWQPDPENPVRQESGYEQGHSVIELV